MNNNLSICLPVPYRPTYEQAKAAVFQSFRASQWILDKTSEEVQWDEANPGKSDAED